MQFPLLSHGTFFALIHGYCIACKSRTNAIGVVRVVVVVGVASRVHIPEVVRVASIRGAQPPVR